MLIPLTPDVQARVVLCNEEQRNTAPSQHVAPYGLSPSFKRAPRENSSLSDPPNDVTKPLRASASRHSNTSNAEENFTTMAVKRKRMPATRNNVLRRSQSSYNLLSDTRTAEESDRAVVHRSRSMAMISQARVPQRCLEDDERGREREAKAAAKAALPSRMRCMRHVLGFRKYNKLPEMRKKIIEACDIIEFMARSQHSAYQLALDQVEKSLEELASAEHHYYKETDRARQFEEKVDELDYLKANIELCIKQSVTFMKNKYYTEYLPLVGTGSAEVEERRWRDHKEIRIFVNQIKTNLEQVQEQEEKEGSVPTISLIQKEIREARAQCAHVRVWRNLQPLFEAEDELEVLRGHLDKIQRSEMRLKASLLRYQASTNTLINVNREVKATMRILRAKAELAAGMVDSETRDLDEEERLLREFVITARHYESGPPPSMAPGFSPQDSLPPLSTDTRITPLTSPPVWLNTWSPTTKVLFKHGEYKDV